MIFGFALSRAAGEAQGSNVSPQSHQRAFVQCADKVVGAIRKHFGLASAVKQRLEFRRGVIHGCLTHDMHERLPGLLQKRTLHGSLRNRTAKLL